MPDLTAGLDAPEVNGLAYKGKGGQWDEPLIPTTYGFGIYGLRSIRDTVQTLEGPFDDAVVEYGDLIYDYCLRDPVAFGSVELLKRAGLTNLPRAVPRVQLRKGREKTATPEQLAEADLSRECADLCTYAQENMDIPIEEILLDLSDAMVYGSKLGELVCRMEPSGPYRGMLMPDAIDVKPRRSWEFVVDRRLKPVGIQANSIEGAGVQVYPVFKFPYMTWGRKNGDPRGSSVCQHVPKFYNIRAQLVPEHFKFCQRFATPVPYATLPPKDQMGNDPKDGKSFADKVREMLDRMKNGYSGVLPYQGQFGFAEPNSKGETFLSALDYYGRQIVLGILLQVRATMEAEHGSRADSDTGKDILANMIGYVRRWIARFMEFQFYYKIVYINKGPEIALRHTPKCDMGKVTKENVAAFVDGIAKLFSIGFISPSQVAELDAAADLPERSEEDLDRMGQTMAPTPAPTDAPAEDDPSPSVDTTVVATTDVQATALNGAQMKALQEIVQSVADGTLPGDSARAMLKASFPTLTDADVDAIVTPAEAMAEDAASRPPPPAPNGPPFGQPNRPPTPPPPGPPGSEAPADGGDTTPPEPAPGEPGPSQ